MVITITTNGTGATNLIATLADTVAGDSFTAAGCIPAAGTALTCYVVSGGNTMRIYDYDGSYPGADGVILNVSGQFVAA
jgi:hypothetical protein